MSDHVEVDRSFLLGEALAVVRTLRRELGECEYEVVENGEQQDGYEFIDAGPWLLARWPGQRRAAFRFDLGLRERVLSDGMEPNSWKEMLAERLDEWAVSVLWKDSR